MDNLEFDVFVIGSGVAGRQVAKACVNKGLKTAITDNREYGGTCANRGCDPKKLILGPTEVLEFAKKLEGKGVASLPKLNWKALQKFKRKLTKNIPPALENKLEELGIKLFHQSPRFIDENTLSVEGKIVRAKKIVIATGRIPRKLSFKGNDLLKTSDDFLKMKKLPKRIVFIGAGYIGLEFAHIAARCGSKVTIIESGDSALSAFDGDLVLALIKASKKIGIKFIFNVKVSKIKKLKKNHKIYYNLDGTEQVLKTRTVFNTAGRIPAIDSLDLDNGNVAFSDDGVQCNDFMQNPTNLNVYTCGDVANHSLPLTPLSGIEAHVVSENIINNNIKKINTPLVPSVVFTLPNLASVGFQEAEAKKRYKNVIVNYKSAENWYNAKRINQSIYAYKILINKRTNEVVGAHLIGPDAAETINLFAVIIQKKITVDEVKNMVFTYPSWSNDIKSMV